MNRFNAVTSALFDPLLAPFGDEHAWFDLVFWSVLGGIVALQAIRVGSFDIDASIQTLPLNRPKEPRPLTTPFTQARRALKFIDE